MVHIMVSVNTSNIQVREGWSESEFVSTDKFTHEYEHNEFGCGDTKEREIRREHINDGDM